MSSIKVVDINNEEAKQEEAIEQPIEEDLKLAKLVSRALRQRRS